MRTDADVLDRVEQLIEPDSRLRHSLWLFFLDRDDVQSPVIVPIDDVPDDPDPGLVGSLCWTIGQVLADTVQGGSVIITLTRPGQAVLEDADRTWHERLLAGAAAHSARIRMMCLATPEGVLPLAS